MKKAIIEIQNVNFAYEKNAPLLIDVSTKIFEKEFVAIIGPNGSGKTTLLKLMMGFLSPTSGEVKLFGEAPERHHLTIGYVPQVSLYDLKFPISVYDVVVMGCLSHLNWRGSYSAQAKKSALDALEKVGLVYLKDRPFGTLSGGQAQRVLIARAISGSPSVLFLDEPTASIDIETQKAILKLLIELKNEMTIVMVTHHLQSFVQDVSRVFCVQNQLTEFSSSQICEHFALGVFHSPLVNIKGK